MSRRMSPLRYPGGKSQLYRFIKYTIKQNEIPNPIYAEPFAGGAGLAIELLFRGDVQSIIINDIDKAIHSFWHSVLHKSEEFINMIETTPINISEWERQKNIYSNEDNHNSLELGFATFYLNRTNRSGIIKGGPISRRNNGKYPIQCRFNKKGLINRIRRISSLRDRINLFDYDAVYFINNVLPEYKSEELFIFFDPPYYKQGKNLYKNFYDHRDHEELSQEIKSISDSNWITTYDFSEEIAKLYADVPSKIYQLQYSANRKRKEKEYLFHNKNTLVSSFDKVQFING